jgi:hypothetical protein
MIYLTIGIGRQHVMVNTCAAGTLAEYGNQIRISAKVTDVITHPSKHLNINTSFEIYI